MEELLDHLYAFYQIDSTTIWVMTMLCMTAAYFIRPHLKNPASAWVMCTLFLIVAMTTYALAHQLHYFSPKRTVEWLTFTTFSASIGAIMGILLVAMLRMIQDRLIVASHIRATLRRDVEQTARGYPQDMV